VQHYGKTRCHEAAPRDPGKRACAGAHTSGPGTRMEPTGPRGHRHRIRIASTRSHKPELAAVLSPRPHSQSRRPGGPRVQALWGHLRPRPLDRSKERERTAAANRITVQLIDCFSPTPLYYRALFSLSSRSLSCFFFFTSFQCAVSGIADVLMCTVH